MAGEDGASGASIAKVDLGARLAREMKLVIVESPAKAKTIAGYLGKEFVVESSIGHIRDLPHNAAEIPAKYKSESWSRLGVDVDNGFQPLYVVDSRKKKVVSDLKAKLKNADELLLATDEDREGEAIAWHLREVLQPKVPVRRMVFHEITRPAIERALTETRDIDDDLVDAQETRRILDRLYGYEVSPVLWRKIMQGLSAGRVQSVATRLVVERERERMAFVAAGYWDIVATFDPGAFDARLSAVDGRRVAQGRDFDQQGKLRTADAVQLGEDDARALASALDGSTFTVSSVEEKPYTRRPAPPFMTSTLQQEASRKLRLSSQQTMRVAQRLYENGYITYMRTDSTTLSESALAAARDQARELYGAETVPAEPRQYTRKVKNAQEAHEAIRPAGDKFRTPDDVRRELSADEFNVYDLIWKRTVASQMADARGQTVSVRITGTASDGRTAEFATAGTVITFRGFLLAYEEGRDEPTTDDEERLLPKLAEGDDLNASRLDPDGHSTSPPSRYTEATLVKALEERGIGRPSTYAAIMGTILDRGYVRKQGQALVPEFLAFAVVNLLEKHFARLVDYEFTARLEDDLDEIASGEEKRDEWLRRFYFGVDGEAGLKELVEGTARRDRRSRGQHGRAAGHGHRRARRALRPVPRARRGTPDAAARHRARRAQARARRGAACAGPARPGAGRRPRDRPGDHRQGRTVRAVRDRGRGRRRQAPHRLALLLDVARDGDARGRAPAPDAPPNPGRVRGRRGRRRQRPLWAVREEGEGIAVDRQRGAAVHDHARGGAREARRAPPDRPPRGRPAAQGAGRRPGQRQAGRAQGRPLRPLCH